MNTQEEQDQSLTVLPVADGPRPLPPLLYMITPLNDKVLDRQATAPAVLLLLLLLLLLDDTKLSSIVDAVRVAWLNTNANAPPPPPPLLLLLT